MTQSETTPLRHFLSAELVGLKVAADGGEVEDESE